MLALIFNTCLKASRVPLVWKISKKIQLPKSGDPSLPKNWRPISLGSTIYKLFAGLVSKRLSDWVESNQILSPCQKGFRSFDGAFENNYVVSQKLQEARVKHSDLCIVSLDFSNAFGSVPHASVFAALESYGAGDTFSKLIRDIYSEGSTCLLTADGASEFTDIKEGVKQGCPLSGILLNLTIDPILKRIQGDSPEFEALAFADDVLLFGNSPAELQRHIDSVCWPIESAFVLTQKSAFPSIWPFVPLVVSRLRSS